MHRILPPLLLAAALLGAAASGPARASSTQWSVIQDDRQFLYSGSAVGERALEEAQGLGATTLSVIVVWSRLALAAGSRSRLAVDLRDPRSYGSWGAYDELVAVAQA